MTRSAIKLIASLYLVVIVVCLAEDTDHSEVDDSAADETEADEIVAEEKKLIRMELEDEYFVGLAPLVMGTVIGKPDQCGVYGSRCNQTFHCCQYFRRGKIACIDERCLQARCGLPRQHCGIFFGDCCFHLGLQCQGNGFRGKCHLALLWDN